MRTLEDEVALDLAAAAGIGFVAGLRSMTAPAVVGWAIHQPSSTPLSGKLAFLNDRRTAWVFTALALGELIVDKLPGVPNRTAPPSLAARVATGAFAAVALSASRRRSKAAGALLGALGAVAGSYVGLAARRKIVNKTNAKDPLVAVAEDALAIGGGLLLSRVA